MIEAEKPISLIAISRSEDPISFEYWSGVKNCESEFPCSAKSRSQPSPGVWGLGELQPEVSIPNEVATQRTPGVWGLAGNGNV